MFSISDTAVPLICDMSSDVFSRMTDVSQFDLKELDHLLSIRCAKPVDIPVPEMMGLDPAFTTCCDML